MLTQDDYEQDYEHDYYQDNQCQDDYYQDIEIQDDQSNSPGIKILEAIDRIVPKLTPSALTILSICMVEDISMDFPDVKIALGRALFKLPKGTFQEVLLPQINGLTIFNSPTISCLLKQKYNKISPSLIGNDKLFENQRATPWYIELMEEIYDALSDFMLSMPLTVGSDVITYVTNFSFSIQPGSKRKINTNFRWPKYFGIPMKLELKSENYILKKKIITALFEEQNGPAVSLEKTGALFPQLGQAINGFKNDSGTVKSDNTNIIHWVDNHLSIDLVDQCYDGIFAPVDVDSRIQFTILNTSNDVIEVNTGTKLADLKISFGTKLSL